MPSNGRRLDRRRFRRRAGRRALLRDRHHPPSSRRGLAQAGSDIAALTALQKRLLQKAITLLKPGGTLVYCTCSLEPEEGEQAIAALLASEPACDARRSTPREVAGLTDILTPEGDLRTLPCHLPHADPTLGGLDGFYAARLIQNPDICKAELFASPIHTPRFKDGALPAVSGLKGCAVSSAQRIRGNPYTEGARVGRSSQTHFDADPRPFRSERHRARQRGSAALSRLWPGRTDRLIIAPHDLRTADATRAAEIYAGRFVFAGKIVTCHCRSIFDLEPPSEDWEAALLGFGWLRHLRAADTAITRANARSLVDDWMSNPTRRRPLARRADVHGAPRHLAVVAGAAGAQRYRRKILSPLFARADPRNPLPAFQPA